MLFHTRLLLLTVAGFLCESTKSSIEVDDHPAEAQKSPFYKDGAMYIPISKKASEDLYKHWVDQAFSGLMAAMATVKISVASKSEKNIHQECAKRAKSVQTHAHCVTHLFDSVEKRQKQQWTRFFRKLYIRRTNLKQKVPMEWIGGFRTSRLKRSVVNQAKYNLIGENDRSPIGRLVRQLTKTVRILKNKKEEKSWSMVLAEIQSKAREIMKKKEMEKNMRRRMIAFTKAANSSNLLSMVNEKRPLAIPDIEEIFHENDEQNMLNDAMKKIEMLPPEQKAMNAPAELIREAIKLGMVATGHNVSGFEEKNLKIISPQIMSVVPREQNSRDNEIDILSPSLLSFHSEGTEFEKITSLPSLLGKLKGSNQQDLLDFIIETSGVSDALKMATKSKEKESKYELNNARGPNGQPLYFTKENVTKMYGDFEERKIEVFEKLQATFNDKQLREMNRTGYAVLSPSQRQIVYGPSSPFNNSITLKAIGNMSDLDVHRSVSAIVRNVANGHAQFEASGSASIPTPSPGRPSIALTYIYFSHEPDYPIVLKVIAAYNNI